MTTDLTRHPHLPETPFVKAVWAESYDFTTDRIVMGDTSSESGMPWPKNDADLAAFREETRDHVLVMGSTTYDHLPPHMKLPSSTKERPIIILTSRITEYIHKTTGLLAVQPLNPTGTIEHGVMLQWLQKWPEFAGKKIAVIGGARVIDAFKPYYDEMVVTWHPGRHYPSADVGAPRTSIFDGFIATDDTKELDTVQLPENNLPRSIRLTRFTRKENA
nr:Dihydrofolate reductase [uncultured bacterium]